MDFIKKLLAKPQNTTPWDWRHIGAIFLILYYWGIAGVQDISGNGTFYGLMADSFLSGQTYLPYSLPEEIASRPNPVRYILKHGYAHFSDLIIYNKHLYSPYGPVPALLLFAPFKYLTDMSMSTQFASFLFTALGTIATIGIMVSLAHRMGIENRLVMILSAFILTVGTFIPFQLKLGSHYQVALGAAYCFTAFGLWCAVLAMDKPVGKPLWLAAASLCLGLAAGCRIHFILTAIVLLPVAWHVAGAHGWRPSLPLLQRLAAIGLPFGLCIAALAAYNYVRFDTIFSIGFEWIVSFNVNPPMTIKNTLINLYLYWLHWIPLDLRPPFFHPEPCCQMHVPWDFERANHTKLVLPRQETIYGALTNAPFLGMLIFMPLLLAHKRYRGILLTMVGISLTLSLALAMSLMATMRYLVDFVPWLMVVACLSYMAALKHYAGSPRIRIIQILGIITAAYTIACGFIIGFIGYNGNI